MMLIYSSSSDTDVSVRHSSASSDPLESLLWHPCHWDSGGCRREVVEYDAGNNNGGKRMLTTVPGLAARCYATGEAGNDRKVSIAT